MDIMGFSDMAILLPQCHNLSHTHLQRARKDQVADSPKTTTFHLERDHHHHLQESHHVSFFAPILMDSIIKERYFWREINIIQSNKY